MVCTEQINAPLVTSLTSSTLFNPLILNLINAIQSAHVIEEPIQDEIQ